MDFAQKGIDYIKSLSDYELKVQIQKYGTKERFVKEVLNHLIFDEFAKGEK